MTPSEYPSPDSPGNRATRGVAQNHPIELVPAPVAFARLHRLFADTIDLYVEYVERHGYSPERAHSQAILETIDGVQAEREIHTWELEDAGENRAWTVRL